MVGDGRLRVRTWQDTATCPGLQGMDPPADQWNKDLIRGITNRGGLEGVRVERDVGGLRGPEVAEAVGRKGVQVVAGASRSVAAEHQHLRAIRPRHRSSIRAASGCVQLSVGRLGPCPRLQPEDVDVRRLDSSRVTANDDQALAGGLGVGAVAVGQVRDSG